MFSVTSHHEEEELVKGTGDNMTGPVHQENPRETRKGTREEAEGVSQGHQSGCETLMTFPTGESHQRKGNGEEAQR